MIQVGEDPGRDLFLRTATQDTKDSEGVRVCS